MLNLVYLSKLPNLSICNEYLYQMPVFIEKYILIFFVEWYEKSIISKSIKQRFFPVDSKYYQTVLTLCIRSL